MMQFEVTFNRLGVIRSKFQVQAIECKLAGVWHYDGKPYLPDSEEVEALLPYHYRKAFNRTRVWWAREFSDLVRVDLHDLRGFPLGTIHATLTGKKS